MELQALQALKEYKVYKARMEILVLPVLLVRKAKMPLLQSQRQPLLVLQMAICGLTLPY
jgi:hypothetical protein